MDDLKGLYFRIENPIDNKVKWNKLLNIYSTSTSFDDFYSKIAVNEISDSIHYDEDDRDNFCLMMWSSWKNLLLSFSESELNSYIEQKVFDSNVYEVVKIVRELESIRNISSLKETLQNEMINKYFSKLFNINDHNVSIYSFFGLKKDTSYNTIFNITVSAKYLYKLLKLFINQCINSELSYYIKYNECNKNVVVSIYTTINDAKKVESFLNTLKKEYYTFFIENKNNLLYGNINEWISIKNKDYFNEEEYLKSRSSILFKSLNSVIYEYVINHLNILVSYKDGRMNLIEYLSNNVMEKVVSDLLNSNIKTNSEYFFIANSEDLINLKSYIKDKLILGIKDILRERLYLKDDFDKIKFQLNSNKSIDINVNVFMSAIRNLTLTMMLKDNTLEKALELE